MARAKSAYSCTECGALSPKWQGQCPHCGGWNSLTEVVAPTRRAAAAIAGAAAAVQPLAAVEARELSRQPTGIGELDRVLGGGLVPGAVILLGGDPGIGKSTLLLQAVAALGSGRRVLYVSGEESADQVALRARRLGVGAAPVLLLAETRIEAILGTVRAERASLVVVDSIQTVYSDALESAPGSVAQVRECAAQLTRLAKGEGVSVFLIGHVTKEGAIAGPRVLEHMVDTVLYFEGDPHSSFRLVRAIKNRFGAANELGVFAMTETGLKGVNNPSALFVAHHGRPVPGSSVLVTLEGTRPLLVEVQGLVDTAQGVSPRRLAVGMDPNRLAMLLAVLHRHAGVSLGVSDVFVNAVGGMRIGEPAADLAILLSIYSSFSNKALSRSLAVFGEVGLSGEVRAVQRGMDRIAEAKRVGYTKLLMPKLNKPKQTIDGIELISISRIEDAIAAVREAD